MTRFNIYQTSDSIKKRLRLKQFFGEKQFQPNANVIGGDLIPVLLKDGQKEIYIHTMRYGVSKYNNHDITPSARVETIFTSTSWNSILNQRCIIIAKGIYVFKREEVIDAESGKALIHYQPYYVPASSSNKTEGAYFYLAALYSKQATYTGYKFAAVSITQSSDAHVDLKEFGNRIPCILNVQQAIEWLDGASAKSILLSKTRLQCKQYHKIGLWINNKNEKREHIILQSKDQWDLEQTCNQEAEALGLNDEAIVGILDKMEHSANQSWKKSKRSYQYFDAYNDDIAN